MPILAILFLISLAGIVAGLVLPDAAGLLLIAVPCALACLFHLIRLWLKRRQRAKRKAQRVPHPRRSRKRPPPMIVVDGSNVMHWKDGVPQLKTVSEVLGRITEMGFQPGVMFDANAGYLLTDRYLHHHDFARLLGVPVERVMVVPKGTPADPYILTAARDLKAPVVTNDRFRDWAEAFPEVKKTGYLIRGDYRDGELWLDLEAAKPRRPARNAQPQKRAPRGTPS